MESNQYSKNFNIFNQINSLNYKRIYNYKYLEISKSKDQILKKEKDNLELNGIDPFVKV